MGRSGRRRTTRGRAAIGAAAVLVSTVLAVGSALPWGVPAGASVASVALPLRGIVPPRNPARSLAPKPDFFSDPRCGYTGMNDTAACNAVILQAIANARKVLEHMGALGFKMSAYLKLTQPEQLFVVADVERTARGLAPIEGMTAQLDYFAEKGAIAGEDPSLPSTPYHLKGGGVALTYGANWAGQNENALGSDYGWMYNDGPHGFNFDCPHAGAPGCWGHRDNILRDYAAVASDCQYEHAGPGAHTVMGAAVVPKSRNGWRESMTQLFVEACGKAPTEFFTWARARKLLFPPRR